MYNIMQLEDNSKNILRDLEIHSSEVTEEEEVFMDA